MTRGIATSTLLRCVLVGSAFLVVLVGEGCSSNPNAPTLANGSMSARFDNGNWAADVSIAATFNGGVLAISGVDSNNRSIVFAITNASMGTFTIANHGVQGLNFNLVLGAQVWQAAFANGSGTLNVTALSSSGAKGTFEFTANAVANSGATGTKVVTEGRFDVRF